MKSKVLKISAVTGILLLGIMIYMIGPEKIIINLKKISWLNFLVLFLLRVLYWLLRTMNWKVIINRLGEDLSLLHLFMVRMSGHAVSQLTPTSQIGSEATRLMMTRAGSRKISMASIILDKTIEFFAVIFMSSIGIIAAFMTISFPVAMKRFFVIGFLVLCFLLLALFIKQRSGILCWMVRLLDKLKLRLKFIEKNREKLRETDEYIVAFYTHHKPVFFLVFFMNVLMILLWVTEIFLIIQMLGVVSVTFMDSLIITTLGNIAFVFPFLPGSLGIYEATYIGLFALVNIQADIAITAVFIRRLIALLLSGPGLIFFWCLGNSLRKGKGEAVSAVSSTQPDEMGEP